jgi:copper chaperone NosL
VRIVEFIYKIIFISSIGFLCLVAMSCTPNSNEYKSHDLQMTTTCSKCGMIIADYAGPHAQIVWKNGRHSFYCDLFEIMPDILNNAESERIGAIYVQKGFPKKGTLSGWVNAKKAIYVVNSRKLGSMGISYVPFKYIKNARTFQRKNGGKILRFSQINNEVLEHTRSLMRTNPQEYSPNYGPGLL